MRAAANTADGSIWAADKGRITRIARQTRALAEMERPIYGVYSAMGARSGDYRRNLRRPDRRDVVRTDQYFAKTPVSPNR